MPTSRYDRSIKVRQSTLDEMKKMGMSKAIEHANSGDASDEFKEAAKRFYGGNRVKVQNAANQATAEKRGPVGNRAVPSTGPKTDSKPAPVANTRPAPPQAAVERRVANLNAKKGIVGNVGPKVFPKDYAHSPVGKLVSKGNRWVNKNLFGKKAN